MKSLISNWFPFTSMGMDETLSDVAERVNIRYPMCRISLPQDAHVIAWETMKERSALDWLYAQRTTKDWDK